MTKSIDALTKEFEKKFGSDAMLTGEDRLPQQGTIPCIPSRIPTLDYALGIGGLPRGRIIEVFGLEGSGKTLIIGLFIAEAQRQNGLGAIVDAEHALHPELMRLAGVDWATLRVLLPKNGEEGLEMAESLVASNLFDVVGVDSVASLVSQKEIDGDYNDVHMAPLARLMSQGLRKLAPIIGESNSILIFNNQIRQRPGVSFGSPDYQPGGKALPFYSSVRLHVSTGDKFKDSNKQQIGHRIKVLVKKSKVAAPHFTAAFNLYYRDGFHEGYGEVEKGVDVGEAYMTFAESQGLLLNSGSWFALAHPETGEELGKWSGRYKTSTAIMEFQELLDGLIY